MKKVTPIGALLLAILGCAGAAWGDDSRKGKAAGDELPFKEQITWDVKLFEGESDSLIFVKRSSDDAKREVGWVMEIKTDEAVKRFQTASEYDGLRNFQQTIVPRYSVVFYDEDRVKVARGPLKLTGAIAKGDRVRAVLTMPDEKIVKNVKTAKLVLEADKD